MKSRKSTRIISQDFGTKLKGYRLNKGLTLKDLSDATGISAAYINKLELGERSCPTIVIVEALSKALGVDFDKLICHTGKCESKQKDIHDVLASNTFLINGSAITPGTKLKVLKIIDFIFLKDTDLNSFDNVVEFINNIKLFRIGIQNKEKL